MASEIGGWMLNPKEIPQEALASCLAELQDDFDVRLEQWSISRFAQRVQCGDYEAALMAVRVRDRKVLLNYVRIPYERVQETKGSALDLWTLIQGRLIVGIGELNECVDMQSFQEKYPDPIAAP
jgi:hypothetical protein